MAHEFGNQSQPQPQIYHQISLDDLSQVESVSRLRLQTVPSGPSITTCPDGTLKVDMDMMNESSNCFYVRWNNLCFSVNSNWCGDYHSKTILKNLDGFFMSGELIALMGPSGKF